MGSQYKTAQDAIEHYDKAVSDYFKKDDFSLSKAADFFKGLKSVFAEDGWPILAKACSMSATLYENPTLTQDRESLARLQNIYK